MRLFVLAKGELGVSAFALCEPCRQPFDPVPPHPCSHGCARPQRGTDHVDIFRRKPDSMVSQAYYDQVGIFGAQSDLPLAHGHNGTIVPMRLVENLSHRQRELTPPAFAEYLVSEVRRRYGCWTVAALWVCRDSPYRQLAGVECWGVLEDAYKYPGPYPVICHPPCGPWGKYRAVSRQDAHAGLVALGFVDTWGGVLEQPASSSLFRGGLVINQSDFGHPAQKATRLYWAGHET
jgi:hypothetical protein